MSLDDLDSLSFLDDLPIPSSSIQKKYNRISLKQFLQAYVEASNNGGDSVDVAAKLGITPQGVRQRAGKLLKKGVKLPNLGNICKKEKSI